MNSELHVHERHTIIGMVLETLFKPKKGSAKSSASQLPPEAPQAPPPRSEETPPQVTYKLVYANVDPLGKHLEKMEIISTQACGLISFQVFPSFSFRVPDKVIGRYPSNMGQSPSYNRYLRARRPLPTSFPRTSTPSLQYYQPLPTAVSPLRSTNEQLCFTVTSVFGLMVL